MEERNYRNFVGSFCNFSIGQRLCQNKKLEEAGLCLEARERQPRGGLSSSVEFCCPVVQMLSAAALSGLGVELGAPND